MPREERTSSEFPDLTLDGVIAACKALRLEDIGPWAKVDSLRVAPDVFARLSHELPHSTKVEAHHTIPIIVDKWLPKGAIVPLDVDGKPILKPKEQRT